MTVEPILKVQEVTKTFGGIIALNRISFDLLKVKFLGLSAPTDPARPLWSTA